MQRVVENLGGGNKDKASANINPSAIIVVAGITKVFVGELVEEGIYNMMMNQHEY